MTNTDCFALVQVLLYHITQKELYKHDLEVTFNDVWLPTGNITYTPKGLAWRLQWGSNRYATVGQQQICMYVYTSGFSVSIDWST